MLRVLRWLFTGYWGPSDALGSLRKRICDLEEGLDYLSVSVRRLRGHLTGGIRYEPDGVVDGDPDAEGFPEEEFQHLLAQKRGISAYVRDQAEHNSDDLSGLQS